MENNNNNNNLFFNIIRDRYLNSIIISHWSPIFLEHISQLDKYQNNFTGKQIIYNINSKDKLTLYEKHHLSYLITDLIVNYEFLSILQKKNAKIYGINFILQQEQPLLFKKDVIDISDDLMNIQYLRTTYPILCKLSRVPTSLTCLYLDIITPTRVDHIPLSVKCLIIDTKHGFLHISRDVIPDNITNIQFKYLKQTVPSNIFPSSVKYLNMPGIDSLVSDSSCLPLNVEFLDLGRKELVRNLIPKSVRKLVCANHSQDPIQQRMFPPNLTDLYINDGYKNKQLDLNAIPNTVTTLGFGPAYAYPLSENDIPPSVTSLHMSSLYAQSFVPQNIVSLEVPNLFKDPDLPNLPQTLTSLVAQNSMIQQLPKDYFPHSLIKLHIFLESVSPGTIPPNITDLSIRTDSSLCLGSIPYGVKKLFIISSPEPVIPKGVIPTTVVKFGLEYLVEKNQLADIVIPDSVTSLYLYHKSNDIFSSPAFKIPPPNVIPSSVSILKFGNSHFTPLQVPSCIQQIKIKKGYAFHRKNDIISNNPHLKILQYSDKLERFRYHVIDSNIYCEEYTKNEK